MTAIRIIVHSNGTNLEVQEQDPTPVKTEDESGRLARMMRTALGKVERTYGFHVAESPAAPPASIDVGPRTVSLPELPAPTAYDDVNGAPRWYLSRDGLDAAAFITRHEDTSVFTMIRDGGWTADEARALALSILAATDWKQEDDTDGGS